METKHEPDWHGIADELLAMADELLAQISQVAVDDPQAMHKCATASLTAKARTDLAAMLLLCREGFADAAQALARTVIEGCINLFYVHEAPASRAEAFWAYGVRQRARIGRRMEALRPMGQTNRPELQEWEEVLDDSVNKWPRRLSDMVEHLGDGIRDKLHGLFYDMLSNYCHSLPLALEIHYDLPPEGNVIHIGRNQALATHFRQLDIVCACFWAMLGPGYEVSGVPAPERFAEIGEIIRTVYATDG